MSSKAFPQDEYERRWERARELMHDSGLDAVIVTERSNYNYFTGHSSLQFGNKMRPMIFVLPRRGSPVAVVYGLEEPEVRRSTWVDTIYTYVDVPFPTDLLIEVIKDLSLVRGRIGWELGGNQRLWLPVDTFNAMRKELPDARFWDASAVYTECRLIKSELEIATIREACRISELAYELVLRRLRPGLTMGECRRLVLRALVDAGSDPDSAGFALLDPLGRGDDYVYRPGDYFLCDFGGSYHGYKADMARLATFGPPTPVQRQDHEQITTIQHEIFAMLVPGTPIREVVDVFNRKMNNLGYPPLQHTKRIGHGIGLDLQEPPSLNAVEPRDLVEGMVITPEPRFVREDSFVIVEETVAITADGPTSLSRGFEKLRIIET